MIKQDLEEVKDIVLDSNKDFRENDFHFIEMNFDFCNGSKNPFENIKFYNGNNNGENGFGYAELN